ncbi:MAG TPA: regulatory protein RecX [Anaerovoracaceae bacterium]|nr:regulatory protein RecX [Anaerovoracaceae bacterium]
MAKDCRDTALSYLEHRARTACEVKAHLLSKGFPEEETEEALRYLQELGYLDDAGYCREYIRYGISKGRGPVRLQSELAEKGIDAALIREALEEDFDRQAEKDSAMREAYKIIRPGRDIDVAFDGERASGPDGIKQADDQPGGRPDEKTVAKIGRKLSSLGYHTEVIYEVLGHFMQSREPD